VLMKHLLKIKLWVEKEFPVQVRAARLAEKPSAPVRKPVLVILPDGKVVRSPKPPRSLFKNLPRCGSLERAALPPWQSRPARCVRASAVPRQLRLSLSEVVHVRIKDEPTLPSISSTAANRR